MDGFNSTLASRAPGLEGLSKISVQSGTTHGGTVLPDGTIADVKIDFETLRNLSEVARKEYGLAGAVQHGASTLRDADFNHFPLTEPPRFISRRISRRCSTIAFLMTCVARFTIGS